MNVVFDEMSVEVQPTASRGVDAAQGKDAAARTQELDRAVLQRAVEQLCERKARLLAY
jgi:hypothetical protein